MADPLKVPIDPNGNLATKTEGTDNWVYEWNARNELTRVLKNSIEQARFAYDPLGRRVEKVAGGMTTSDVYDGPDVLREVRGTTTLEYVHGPRTDEVLLVTSGGQPSYLHADGLGSISKSTDSTGAVTLTRLYDAWGRLESGANEPGHAFTGREWDPETGLYYYRARYYDPKAGRFTAEDPIGFGDGPNVYVYVGDRPVNRTDPEGRWAALVVAAVVVTVALVVAYETNESFHKWVNTMAGPAAANTAEAAGHAAKAAGRAAGGAAAEAAGAAIEGGMAGMEGARTIIERRRRQYCAYLGAEYGWCDPECKAVPPPFPPPDPPPHCPCGEQQR